MNNEKNLLVLSGPSGSGKDTLMRHLVQRCPEIRLSVSATTRERRPAEQEGIDYYYLSKEEFERRIQQGDLLEYTHYCGNFYGTLKSEVDGRLAKGEPVALVIEVEGAANIKRIYPDSTAIFIKPPSMEELERRLHYRNTESEEKIAARLRRAVEELKYADKYDYVLVNDDIEACTQAVYEIFAKRRQEG